MAPSPNDPVAEAGPDDLTRGSGDAPDPLAELRRVAARPGRPWLPGLADAIGSWRADATDRAGRPLLVRVASLVAALVVLGGAVVVWRGGSGASSGADPAASLPRAGSGTTVADPVSADGVPGATGTTRPTSGDLVVQAAGAVVRPGLYHLAAGARVADLIDQAGGFTPDADTDRVNLASPLADGVRVWVPRRGEADPPSAVGGGGEGGSGGSSGTGPAALVDLNTATADELDALPGVGPATAAAIIDHRQRHGPFRSVDELADVRGIGDAKLAQLRELVRV